MDKETEIGIARLEPEDGVVWGAASLEPENGVVFGAVNLDALPITLTA